MTKNKDHTEIRWQFAKDEETERQKKCRPRIIELSGLEGTSRIMNLQLPCHRQAQQPPHLILDQAVQGHIQPGLEQLQEWGISNLFGQPVPVPHHSHSKELPPDLQPKSSSVVKLTRISSNQVFHGGSRGSHTADNHEDSNMTPDHGFQTLTSETGNYSSYFKQCKSELLKIRKCEY